MPSHEQVITLLESLIIAAAVLILAGLLYKNDSNTEDDLEIRVEATQEPSQQTPFNLHFCNGSLIASEARQVEGQGVVYADLLRALPNNLAG